MLDLPFLFPLHRSFRALEMACIPWSQAAKDTFLDDQFRLQHAYFVEHFPHTDYWIVERGPPAGLAIPIGRFYLDRSASLWRVVDIGFSPEMRSGGLGSTLLTWTQAGAVAAGADGIDLHVVTHNPRAQALYLRLGFRDDGSPQGYHQRMVWRPA